MKRHPVLTIWLKHRVSGAFQRNLVIRKYAAGRNIIRTLRDAVRAPDLLLAEARG